jgi:glutaredoxin-dependent peroxiredoxin
MEVITQTQRDARLITTDRQEITIGSLLGQPIVLAFFPAAFTSVCTAELCALRDGMARLIDLDAKVFGISIDLPMTLHVFATQNGLNFPLLSDCNREAIRAFDVAWPLLSGVIRDTANRAVIVYNAEAKLVYRWVAEAPGNQIPFDAVYDAVAAAHRD